MSDEVTMVGAQQPAGWRITRISDRAISVGDGRMAEPLVISMDVQDRHLRAFYNLAADIVDGLAGRPQAEGDGRASFEAWATSHGGLSVVRVNSGERGAHELWPCTYCQRETEIAWRAWANKPQPKGTGNDRGDFEKAVLPLCSFPRNSRIDRLGRYVDDQLQAAWELWQARTQAPAPAPATAGLRKAAQDVLDRWNSPKWEWAKQGPTADLMAKLREELEASPASAVAHEPVKWWNNCHRSVPEALRYLASNPRPVGGSERFNAEHLLQLAREIERMAAMQLYAAPQPPVQGSGS